MSTSRNHETSSTWQALPADGRADSKELTLTRTQFKRWSLVLSAMQIEYRRENSWRGVQLLVQREEFNAALEQIRQFEQENNNWPPAPPPAVAHHGTLLVTMSVVFLLASFHNLTQYDGALPYLGTPDWYDLGSLHAGKFRQGELWRALTALTLHADMQHLLGNAVVMTLFIEQLRKRYGSGAAWMLLLICGVAGNSVNALLQPWHHVAVGASTAVFGLLGVIGADSFVRYRKALLRRWAMPLAAACALLGFLGTSGDNTDLGAHLWGFVCGLVIGLICAGRWRMHFPPSARSNRLLAASAVTFVLGVWTAALALGG